VSSEEWLQFVHYIRLIIQDWNSLPLRQRLENKVPNVKVTYKHKTK